MATDSIARSRAAWFRANRVVFGAIFLMMAYVIVHNESFLIDRTDEEWKHIETFKWWLLFHGTAGACAVLLAPLQFSDWLRSRFTKMHRVVGWVYVCGVFVLAPIGNYMQYLDEQLGFSRGFTIATTVDALLLMTTTAIALYFILNRRIQQHRQWMTRSYAVALVFFEVRLVSGVLGFDDSNAAGEVIIWICLAMAIPMADVILQIQESRRARPLGGALRS
jgi:uncharacterized membrane protein